MIPPIETTIHRHGSKLIETTIQRQRTHRHMIFSREKTRKVKMALYLVQFCIIFNKNNARTAPSNGDICGEFSDQHQHQSIKKQHI